VVRPNEQSDTELLRLLSNGNEVAMEVLFKRYYSFVTLAVLRLVSDPVTAEDIAQEVFFEIWKRRNSLDIRISLKAYLRKAAVNKTLNFLRDRKNYQNEEISPLQAEIQITNDPTLETNELNALIDQAIEALPDRCKLVFKLSRTEEMSYQEIADQMDISVKTVENQIVKALKMLREALTPYLNGSLLLLIFGILSLGFFSGG